MANNGNNKPVVVTLSFWSMMQVVLIVFGIASFYAIRDVIVLLFVSLILASALHGWVEALSRRHIPRLAGVLIIYIGLFLFASGVIALLVPPLADQLRSMATHFPLAVQQFTGSYSSMRELGDRFGVGEEISRWLESMSSVITQNSGGALSAVTGFFGSLVSIVVVLIITLYIIIEDNAIKNALRSVIPDRYSERVTAVVVEVQRKIGLWLRGQVILMAIIAVLSFFGLLVLGIPNALALALFAGLMEVVPTLGPIIGSLPAIFLGLVESPIKALFVVVFYIIVQQMENHLIVPQVMRKAVGINPVISLISILIGAKIGGVAGALLAIPTVTALKVVIDNIYDNRTNSKKETLSQPSDYAAP